MRLPRPSRRPHGHSGGTWLHVAAGPARQPDRGLRALAGRASRIEPTHAGWRLHLPDTPDVVARAAELAAVERRCCAFLTFTLTLADDLLLDVAAPADARELVGDLFAPAPATVICGA